MPISRSVARLKRITWCLTYIGNANSWRCGLMDWLDEECIKILLASPIWKPPHLPQFQFQFRCCGTIQSSCRKDNLRCCHVAQSVLYSTDSSPEHAHLWWKELHTTPFAAGRHECSRFGRPIKLIFVDPEPNKRLEDLSSCSIKVKK